MFLCSSSGNLDMCLASRLSTQANLGNMTSTKEVISMVVGNISLVQVNIMRNYLVRSSLQDTGEEITYGEA